MYALQRKETANNTVLANILPCRIHHDGPVDISERYWQPEVNATEGCETAYFRGRRLKSRKVTLPEGYEGIVATKTDKVLRSERRRESYGEDGEKGGDEQEVEPTIITADGTFSEIMVWGHENIPGDDDPYVRGIQEWIAFSEKIHDSGDGKPENLEEHN
ncbi:hypothetical protein KEM54_002566 [Ascosphaera aggregata]|nr:hypothetical protein KEM54_002566 [Ascosphaera aggregata]